MALTHLPPTALLQSYEEYRENGLLITAGVAVVLILIWVFPKIRDMGSDYRAKNRPVMDPDQVEELMLGTPPIVVDLRTPEEFKGPRGHLRSALNIPIRDLRKRLDEVRGTTGNRPILLVDNTDELSHLALPLMQQEGFGWVYVLKGGMKAWNRKKLPVYK